MNRLKWCDRAWQWLKSQIAREVPSEMGFCEFNCRKLNCSEGDWRNCDRRKQFEQRIQEE